MCLDPFLRFKLAKQLIKHGNDNNIDILKYSLTVEFDWYFSCSEFPAKNEVLNENKILYCLTVIFWNFAGISLTFTAANEQCWVDDILNKTLMRE